MRCRKPASAALGVAVALAAGAACGGGGGRSATTTTPPSTEASTSTSAEPTTTSTTIDPALQGLLLVAEDLPSGFKETTPAPTPGAGQDEPSACDTVDAPAINAMDDEPTVEGATFSRGTDPATVDVSSQVTATTPEKAEAALNEILDPKVQQCLEADAKSVVDPELPAGVTATLKTTATKSTVSGSDQTVLLSVVATFKSGTTSADYRVDFVFLRKAGTVYLVFYAGPGNRATATERQRIVAVAVRKLSGGGTGATSTTQAGATTTSSAGGGGSTSSTRRSTTTTRRGTTSSTRAGSTSTSR